jgi:hypothetical protein
MDQYMPIARKPSLPAKGYCVSSSNVTPPPIIATTNPLRANAHARVQ